MIRRFFDTNVLVYLFDEDAPERRELAHERFRTAVAEGSFVSSTQVLQEFSKLPVVLVDTAMVVSAARTSRLHTVSFRDAMIIEAARTAGASELLSEDLQEGRRFGPLLVTNPFRPE